MTRLFNDQGGLKKISAQLELAKSKMPTNVRGAHDHCSRHRAEALASDVCGCFYCGQTFPPGEIVDWVDEGKTALCPKCGIDSVLGSAAGFGLTAEFLDEMHRYWF